MKAILSALFVALLLGGCGEPDLSDPEVLEEAKADAVELFTLWKASKGGLPSLPNTDKPYSGFAKHSYENGQVKMLIQLKDGKLDGLRTHWYMNGQKSSEENIKDDKLISYKVWKPNGEKCPVTKIDKHGNGVTVRYWSNGQKSSETTYKDGKPSGPWILYNKDGRELKRLTYKDGKLID